MKIPTAAILVIGDEILSGKTAECNAQFLIGELRELGVALKRIVVISDDVGEVARHTRELSDSFDYVFTSGGVGPTHDDVTIVGIAQASELFGIPRFFTIPPAAGLIWWLVVKGSQKRVERVFLAMSLVFLCYIVSAFLARPDWSLVGVL